MKIQEYHSNLANWFRSYIVYLSNDIESSELWIKYPNINSPGWNLLHLIVEGELAILKIKPDYTIKFKDQNDFMYGSDGNAKSEHTTSDLLDMFREVYMTLNSVVNKNIDLLNEKENEDELLKTVLKTELDFNLHMLTTHLAMHCQELTKWRLHAGKELE